MQLLAREGPAGTGVAGHELAQRVGNVREEGIGQPSGRHRPERVAVEAGLVGRHVALLASDPQADRAAFAFQLPQQPPGVDAVEDPL